MSKPRILHMFSPGTNVSPFDVNMAADAGYQVIVPYSDVQADQVGGLIQDAIFSRAPKMYNYTGAFFGGWDVNLAADMLARAAKAMVPPFEISVFADPNGAYTTAAALVALVGQHLRQHPSHSAEHGYRGLNVAVFGGGPVGLCAAVLIARQGGLPTLVRLTPPRDDKQNAIRRFCDRYDVKLAAADGETDAARTAALADAQVAITTAKAGVQVLSQQQLAQAPHLRVAADVNAVPPTGIEGLQPDHNGVPLNDKDSANDGEHQHDVLLGVGALAVGGLKYKVQNGLLQQMLNADHALVLDFPDAYELASSLV